MSDMVNKIKYENDAVSLLRGSNMAILSTLSKKFDEFFEFQCFILKYQSNMQYLITNSMKMQ